MTKNFRAIAIIQARGGSKGVPRKNLCVLSGHPLIAYSIASGLAAKKIDRVIVSTDDLEIAKVSRSYGAEVPFMRPKELATDTSQDYPLFEHALKWLNDHEGYKPDLVVQLRPTAPFRPKGLIDKSIDIITKDRKLDSVRSVTEPSENPYKMWQINKGGYLKPLIKLNIPESYNLPRQILPKTYWHTGHVDVMLYETIINKRSLTGVNVKPVYVEPQYCVDIDRPEDISRAEWMLDCLNLGIDLPILKSKVRGHHDHR